MVATATTPRKKDVALAFIIERIGRFGVSPSMPEIAGELSVSVARVKTLLDQLEVDGRIERTPGAQRGIRVLEVAECRSMLTEALRNLGWTDVGAVPFPQEHLPMMPMPVHEPRLDWPEPLT